MSDGEVKRWYVYSSEDGALYAVSKNQRGFVPDASTIEVMPVEDHERIVAQKDAEIERLKRERAKYEADCKRIEYFDDLHEKVATQKRVITELERINYTFAWHYDDCTLNTEVDSEECSCGLIEAMNKLEDLKKL